MLRLSEVLPATGPVDGGIAINITGRQLGAGGLYRCCIVPETQSCTDSSSMVASYDAAHDHVRCHTPALVNDAGAYQVCFSLNS